RRATEPYKALVESRCELVERDAAIALWIDGNEYDLDVIGSRPDLGQRFDHRAQRGRALVGAMRVAEIDQEKFLRKIIRGDRLAVRVGEHQRMFEHDPLFLRLCSGDEGGEQHEQQSGRAQLHLIRTPRLGYAAPSR